MYLNLVPSVLISMSRSEVAESSFKTFCLLASLVRHVRHVHRRRVLCCELFLNIKLKRAGDIVVEVVPYNCNWRSVWLLHAVTWLGRLFESCSARFILFFHYLIAFNELQRTSTVVSCKSRGYIQGRSE